MSVYALLDSCSQPHGISLPQLCEDPNDSSELEASREYLGNVSFQLNHSRVATTKQARTTCFSGWDVSFQLDDDDLALSKERTTRRSRAATTQLPPTDPLSRESGSRSTFTNLLTALTGPSKRIEQGFHLTVLICIPRHSIRI